MNNFENLINELFEDEIKSIFKKYENKMFLLNSEVAEILRTTNDNIRKRMEKDDFKGLYEVKKRTKERTLWNKYKFFQWYFTQKINERSEKIAS